MLIEHVQEIVRKIARRLVDLVEQDDRRAWSSISFPQRSRLDEIRLVHSLAMKSRIVRGVEVGYGVEAIEEVFGCGGAADVKRVELIFEAEVPGEIEGHLGLARARLTGEEERRAHGERHVHGVHQISVGLEILGCLAVAAEAGGDRALRQGLPTFGTTVIRSQ